MRSCRLEVRSKIFDHVAPFFLARVKAKVPELMSGVAKLDVPLVAEPGVGMNWEEAH